MDENEAPDGEIVIKMIDRLRLLVEHAGKPAIDFVKQYAQSDAASLPLYAPGFLVEGGALNAEGDSAKNIYNSLNYSPDLDNQANRTFVELAR